MKKHIWLSGGIVVVAVFVAVVLTTHAADSTPASTPAIRTGISRHDFTEKIDNVVKGNYLLYLPEIYGKDQQRLPLILFLHGSGERGRNPNILAKFGPMRVAMEQKNFPFIVLAPQCPRDGFWSDVEVTEMVMALLEKVSREYLVDKNRIYLTGMSMGGFGTWDLAQKYPKRFAALAVVCGWGNPYLQMRLKPIPTKVFHGAKDKRVPVFNARQMAGVLRQVGGDVDLQIYPTQGHFIWKQTYDNPRLYEWFLSNRLPQKTRRITPSTPSSQTTSTPSPTKIPAKE